MCIVLIHCNVFYEVLTPFGLIATVMNKSDDEIEVLATDVIEDAKPRRSSATKKVKKQEGVCMPERERERDPRLYINLDTCIHT